MFKFKLSYEKSVCSQQGEDGVIEVMLNAIKNPNKEAVEFGWGRDYRGKKGVQLEFAQNCTSNLARNKGYKVYAWDLAKQYAVPENVVFHQEYIRPEYVDKYLEIIDNNNVDFFSLDIDSFDYEIMSKLLTKGFRPKTCCLEFNIRWGWEVSHSMPYMSKGRYEKTSLFHGVSFQKYKTLLEGYGYKFFTLESRGINMFFYHPGFVSEEKLPEERQERVKTSKIYTREEMVQEIEKHPYWWKYLKTDDILK